MLTKKEINQLKKLKNKDEAQQYVLKNLQLGTKTHFEMTYKDYKGQEIYEKLKSYKQDDGTYVLLRYQGGKGFMEEVDSFTVAYFETEPHKPTNPIFPITLGILKEAKDIVVFQKLNQ